MATNVGQELTAFSLMQGYSKLANGQNGYDPNLLDVFTKTAEVYERELKRVFGSLVNTVTKIDSVTGQAQRISYIPREYETEAKGVLDSVLKQRTGMNDKKVMYIDTAQAHMVESTREIKGAKAQQYAKEELAEIGGMVKKTPNTANKDMVTTYVPMLDTELSTKTKAELTKETKALTPLANKASTAEQRKRTQDEQEAVREQELKDLAQQKKATDRENLRKTKLADRQQKQRELANIEKEEQEIREKEESKRVMLGRLGVITTAVGTLIDITRRILTSVLSFSSQVSKDVVKANTLNIGYGAVRQFNYMDEALGLGAGTTLQAQEDLRSKFGNTAKLDTESLKWLAMVMGDEVGEMVQSGLGGENPAKLMERILDDFFQRQQEGKDQYGNEVGQEKARRSLVTLLESVSPSIARIFERMIEEQASGLNAGQITSYRQMQTLFIPASGGFTGNDWEQIALIGKQADQLKADFKNLGDLIKGEFTKSLQGVISWASNLKLGKEPDEVLTDKQKAYKWLTDTMKDYTEEQTLAEGKIKDVMSEYGVGDLSIQKAIDLASGEPDSSWSQEQIAMYEGSRGALRAIYSNPKLLSSLKTYYATQDLINAMKKEAGSSKPNADPVKFGKTGLIAQMDKTLDAHAPLLGFSEGLEFAEEEFALRPNESPFERRQRINGVWRIEDIAKEKQGFYTRGAKEFFQSASDWGKDSKYYKDLESVFAKYKKAVKKGYGDETDKNLADMSVDDLLKRYASKNLSEADMMRIFMFGVSPTSETGVSNKVQADLRDLAQYLPDEYGLTTREWKNVNQGIESATKSIPKKYRDYDTITEVTQGSSAGEILIKVQSVDSYGRVVNTEEKTVAGTLEKDFTYNTSIKQSVNEGHERMSD